MSLLRKLPQQISKFSHFHRDGLTGLECEHKTLLVVGVGNIGYEIVRIGNGLGMEVLGVDIIKKYSSVSYVSIEQGLARANIIVCAMNLTSDNLGYFNYQMLKKAEPGAIFVNIARGEMSPSADLLRLLDENHLAGVALDVYNQESELAVSLRTGRSSSNKEVQATLALSKRENVILTPHNAFNTREAVDKKAKYSIQQIEHFFEKGNFIWSVPI
jgi:D-lactate dehydrogenase